MFSRQPPVKVISAPEFSHSVTFRVLYCVEFSLTRSKKEKEECEDFDVASRSFTGRTGFGTKKKRVRAFTPSTLMRS
jgi:hypothetical protein